MSEPFEMMTMKGPISATFEMPDMLALVAGGVDIPNSAAADVLRLISGRLLDTTSDPLAAFQMDKQQVRGVYELVALCVKEPAIFIPRVLGDETPTGAVSYRDLPWAEVMAIYNRFRYGSPLPLPPASDTGPDMGEAATPGGDDLPQSTK